MSTCNFEIHDKYFAGITIPGIIVTRHNHHRLGIDIKERHGRKMPVWLLNTNLKTLFVIIFAIFPAGNAICQQKSLLNSDKGAFSISYTGQITSLSEKKNGILEKIADILIGSNPVVINKPVSCIASDSSELWILSQGNGTIIRSINGLLEIPQIIRKKKFVFPSLVGICFLRKDAVLITDSKLNKVFSLSRDGKNISEFSQGVSLNQPTGIAYSEVREEVWIIETGAHRISVFDPSGKLLKTVGKRGTGDGEFNYPTHISIAKDGTVYVVDGLNYRIQVFDKNGNFRYAFGKQGDATGFMARPKGIATDSYGSIYVADAIFNAIQVFDKAGRLLYYFGTGGQGDGEFMMPSGIFIDHQNRIYVSDCYNHRIQIFKLIQE